MRFHEPRSLCQKCGFLIPMRGNEIGGETVAENFRVIPNPHEG